MKGNIIDYMEMAQSARYGLEKETDRLMDKLTRMENYKKLLGVMDEVLEENRKQQEENRKQQEEIESLRQQLGEEKRQKAEMEMKLAEMTKLSAGMAKKASQNDMEKMLRIFLNTSKRKTMSKREAAKTVILELLNIAKIEISDDVLELLDHLDDEQTEPKVVNVTGNYNDVHDNGGVTVKG